ncbi:MAG TPA: hypothetical protein VHM25_18975 [Polyangiaceae bacterium]|jgi:hypothetical protein|nr:hypothetical protein [Polyangiaceae bacterium]
MPGPQSAKKRQREAARQGHARDKAAKMEERRATKVPRQPVAAGEDPDLAGIVPGPQPKPEGEEDWVVPPPVAPR